MLEQPPPPPAELGRRRDDVVAGPTGPIAFTRRGSGPTLLMLHPLALSGAVWDELAGRLAADYEVITPDARGHGRSGWDGRDFTMTELAEDVTALLDGLELQSAHVLGMSMGGSAALTFAGLYPERVERLLLADTTAWYGPGASAAWAERAEKAVSVARERQVPFQADRWFTDTFRARRPDVVNFVAGIFIATDSLVHAAASRAMGAMDSRDLLHAITAPTLVLTGDEDYATPPEMGQAIADAVAGGRAEVLPGLRHLSLVERASLAESVAAYFSGKPAAEVPA